MVKAIVGANWGDEGKGKITDVLANDSDIVIRFQGGANAGHTIINDYGKFALHQLPSGVFHQNITNIIGNGVAFSVENFVKEMKELEDRGVSNSTSLPSVAFLIIDWTVSYSSISSLLTNTLNKLFSTPSRSSSFSNINLPGVCTPFSILDNDAGVQIPKLTSSCV